MKDQKPVQSKLFRAEKYRGNVVFNFNGRADDEFDAYAEAFHRSGKLLREQMLSGNGYNDLDACPIFFVYRHALELYLKAIGRIGGEILELIPNEKSSLDNHNLLGLFPLFKRVFKLGSRNWEFDIEGLRSFEDLEQLLKAFDRIDKGSLTFRYPVDKNEQAYFDHHFMANVPSFCDQMDELLDVLDVVVTCLREEILPNYLEGLENPNYVEEPKN